MSDVLRVGGGRVVRKKVPVSIPGILSKTRWPCQSMITRVRRKGGDPGVGRRLGLEDPVEVDRRPLTTLTHMYTTNRICEVVRASKGYLSDPYSVGVSSPEIGEPGDGFCLFGSESWSPGHQGREDPFSVKDYPVIRDQKKTVLGSWETIRPRITCLLTYYGVLKFTPCSYSILTRE